uniref:Fido domain-containing protein n=1 Tax=Globodera pallida TaxID=36090 RepID=A0A183CCC9_GLOPA
MIRDLHILAMGGPNAPIFAGHFRGEFGKEEPASIGAGGHQAPIKDVVAREMLDFVEWLNAATEADFGGQYLAARAFLDFVKLHPVPDGNGRTARLLLAVILRRHGLPALQLEEGDRSTLNGHLRQATTVVGSELRL